MESLSIEVMPVIGVGANLLMVGILAALAIVLLRRILSILEDYAGFIVAIIGLGIMFAPEFVWTHSLIIGVFLVTVGVALAS